MVATDPTTSESRRFSIRLPSPLWIGLAAVVMVVVAMALRIGLPIYRQNVAVQKIERLADCSILYSDSHAPHWLTSWVGDDWIEIFASVEGANLRGERITGVHVDYIREFSDLKWLNLRTTKVTDQDIAHVGESLSLEGLDLCHTRVTDAGLIHLKPLKRLKHLNLAMTGVTDEGVMQLESLQNLTHLNLNSTRVTEKGIAELKRALPGLNVGK